MPDATTHDTNLVVLDGVVVDPPAVRRSVGGMRRATLTVAVRSSGPPRRVDAIPVTWWDPPDTLEGVAVGTRVAVAGALRRRFWATADGRSSRIEVHAATVDLDGAPETSD